MLKYTVFIFLLYSRLLAGICSAIPNGIKGDMAVLKLCNASSPISLKAVNAVLIDRKMEFPEAQSHEFKCFLLCLYVEYGWMDRVGSFELRSIKAGLLPTQLDENRIHILLYKCTAMEFVDPCDRAFHFTECFWAHSSEDEDLDTEIVKEEAGELGGFYVMD